MVNFVAATYLRNKRDVGERLACRGALIYLNGFANHLAFARWYFYTHF